MTWNQLWRIVFLGVMAYNVVTTDGWWSVGYTAIVIGCTVWWGDDRIWGKD